MGLIGSFGDIVFEVSHEKIRTFDEFVRSFSSRWAKHEIDGRKPLSEFLGPDLDEISFKMRFDVSFGVNPKQEMDRLLEKCRSGQPETLIIGGIPLGMHKWVIISGRQSWKRLDGAGRVIVGEVDVTLQEYIAR